MPVQTPSSSSVWQHPFVSIFRHCGTQHWPQGNFSQAGGVKLSVDRTIGHQAFSLSGAVPAANYFQVPQDKAESLGLTGPFLYLQVLLKPGKNYSIHVDAKTTDKNVTRISISNMFSSSSAKQSHITVQVPYAAPDDKWTILALDVAALLEPVTKAAFEEVKKVQFCASMAVRGAFTADSAYSWQDLPKELVLSHAMASSDFSWVWFPKEPAVQQPLPFRELSNIAEAQSSPVMSKSRKPVLAAQPSISKAPAVADRAEQGQQASEAWLQLHHVNGYTGEFTKVLTWLPGSQELVFAAGNIILIMDSRSGAQRHLLGCAGNICALACSADGQLIVSAEAGKPGLIRLWDPAQGQCLALLHGHLGGVNCLDLSVDGRFLVALGLNSHSKQLIVLWDISPLLQGGKAQVVAKHISDYNIKAIKFSPYEEGRLMTCGKDSVRMFRLKLGHLRGMSVQVAPAPGEISKGSWLDTNVFTDIAFETDCGLASFEERHVYVTSISGAVYQINYGKRILERVYQLHSAAINCMLVSAGLCVTASDDKFLRVWPLDFSDYLLEAEHEAAVTGIGLAPDGLTIAVGTENGAIGCLDVPTHQYRTLLRSHTDTINAVAVDMHRGEYCTVSLDGTIRGWSVQTHQQLFELAAPGEIIQCCAYHPDRHELACGFGQGRVRIFNLDDTTLLREHKQHRSTVLQVLYLPSGKLLFSMGGDGNLCVYEVAHSYLPIKYLSTTNQQQAGCMAVSSDSTLLACVSHTDAAAPASILLFDGQTLDAVKRIQSSASGFTCLAFSPDCAHLVATSSDRSLLTYSISSGQLLQEHSDIHKVAVDSLALNPAQSLIATGGADRTIQLHPYLLQPGRPTQQKQQQSFIGHSDSVTGLGWADDETLISTGAQDVIIIWRRTPTQLPQPTFGLDPDSSHITAAADINSSVPLRLTSGTLQQNAQPASPQGAATVQLVSSLAAQAQGDGLTVLVAQPAASIGTVMMPDQADSQQLAERDYLESVELGAASSIAAQRRAVANLPSSQTAAQARSRGSLQHVASSPQGPNSSRAQPGALPSAMGIQPPQDPSSTHSADAAGCLEVERVIGFNGEGQGGCIWLEDIGKLVYAAGCTLIVEELATRHQRRLVQHDRPITTCAASQDGAVLASACPAPEGPSGTAPEAQICLWDVATSTCLHVMHHHIGAVQMLSFSPDGVWLLSAGQEPDQAVAIWDVATAALLTSGHSLQPIRALAWRPGTPLPSFVTISQGKVLAWELEPSHLAQRTLRVPQAALGAPLTALVCQTDALIFVADQLGNVWQLQMATGSNLVTCLKCCTLASPAAITCLQPHGAGLTVATAAGQLVSLTQQQPGSSIWVEQHQISLAHGVTSLCCGRTSGRDAVVGTSSGTLWYVDLEAGSQVPLVTGHPALIASLALPQAVPLPVELPQPQGTAPGHGVVPSQVSNMQMMASTAADGVLRVWQLPPNQSDWHQLCAVMDFESQQACTAAAMISRGGTPCCLAGYQGGCLRLFDLTTASLIWSSEGISKAESILALEASSDCKQVLAVARNGSMSLHASSNGGALAEWQEAAHQEVHVAATAFLPGSKAVCALASAQACTVCSVPWLQAQSGVISRYICPEGPFLGSQLTAEESQTAAVAFGANSSTLVYSSPMLQNKLLLFDFVQGTALQYISMQHHVRVLTGPLQGSSAAFADAEGLIGLVNLYSGSIIELEGCQAQCQALCYYGDSHILLSNGQNMVVCRLSVAVKEQIQL